MMMSASDDGFVLMARSHARQMSLCEDLEAIADGLPGNVNRRLCLYLASVMCPTIAAAHAIEERVLFPAMKSLTVWLPDIDITVERLRWEHFEDICFAEELREALYSIGCGEPVMSAGAAGYMLRGFFESVRRHVAFERDVLSPLMQLALRNERYGAGRFSRSGPSAVQGPGFRHGE